MCQAGKSRERLRRDKFRFAAQLHTADYCRQVHIAATLACSQKRALDLNCAGKNGCASIGNSQAAIRMAVKSEAGIGISPHKAADNLRHFFRACAACGVANHNAADFLARALLR